MKIQLTAQKYRALGSLGPVSPVITGLCNGGELLDQMMEGYVEQWPNSLNSVKERYCGGTGKKVAIDYSCLGCWSMGCWSVFTERRGKREPVKVMITDTIA